jgi:hypothetical protein
MAKYEVIVMLGFEFSFRIQNQPFVVFPRKVTSSSPEMSLFLTDKYCASRTPISGCNHLNHLKNGLVNTFHPFVSFVARSFPSP